MKATITFGKLAIQVDGEKQKDVFEELAKAQEIFSHGTCGKCNNTEVRYVVRQVDDNSFYEIHCQKCYARFAFGQHKGKEGTLFPRRKDKDGNWLPDNGWMKYNTQTGKEE